MSKILIQILILLTMLVFNTDVYAQGRRVSSGDVLDHSLMSLNESAADIRRQNQEIVQQMNRLSEEMKVLQQKTNEAMQNKQKLSSSNQQLKTHISSQKKKLSLAEQELVRLRVNASARAKERKQFINHSEGINLQKGSYEEKVSQLQKDVIKLGEKIEALGYVIKDDYPIRIKNLKLSVKEAKQRIKVTKKELGKLEKHRQRPNNDSERFEKENQKLEHELKLLRDEYERYQSEEDDLSFKINDIHANRKEMLVGYQDRVRYLSKRKVEIETVLGKAQEKIGSNQDFLKFTGGDISGLEENLLTVQQDSRDLKSEYASLERQLNKLESSRSR